MRKLLPALAILLPAASVARAGPLDTPRSIEIGGLYFNHQIVLMAFVAAVVVFVFCWLWSRGFDQDKPTRGQSLLEILVTAFDDLVKQSIGKVRGRNYLPYIGTLFLFLWFSNMMGLFPLPSWRIGGEEILVDYEGDGQYDPGDRFDDENNDGIHQPGFVIPEPKEPTTNVNVPLGLALLFVLLIGHGSDIYYNGICGYIGSYFTPGGVIGLLMFPLNVVGKMAEIVSISFRLFGNIFGGAVIIGVISGLVAYVALPIFLYGFFGVFVGTVQAFVFTMLALTYISSGAAEEE